MKRLNTKKILQEKLTIQNEIEAKFSKKILAAAKKRLCSSCGEKPCFLLPICLNGDDCPYFSKLEIKT